MFKINVNLHAKLTVCFSLGAFSDQKLSLFIMYSACSAACVRLLILGGMSEITVIYRCFWSWGHQNIVFCAFLWRPPGLQVCSKTQFFITYSAGVLENPLSYGILCSCIRKKPLFIMYSAGVFENPLIYRILCRCVRKPPLFILYYASPLGP